jgi:hypothetical protein
VRRYFEPDDPRRRLLIEALAAGVFSSGLIRSGSLAAQVFGNQPTKLPEGQSVFTTSGTVTVNDRAVTMETRIRPGDTVRTSRNSEIIFVVTDCAMKLRADSEVSLEGDSSSTRLTGWRLVGKLLSVYAPGQVKIQTATATARIVGTGVYVEADKEQTYFCTCYGVAEISANDDRASKETVVSKHHDRPLYIVAGGKNSGGSIRGAPFINHTDDELAVIETLVGRTPPFVFPKQYQAPRRPY